MIPVLKSDRLVLRGFTWADFPAFSDMWGDPDLTPFIPFAPVSPPDLWARFNANNSLWCRAGFGNWAVVDIEDRFLGATGFFLNPTAGVSEFYDASIQSGWVFAAQARGQGIASEAVELAHKWIDQQPFGDVTVCGMDVNHAASIRIAEKVGYTVLERTEDKWGAMQSMVRRI